jgi:hypothetical protein
MDDGHDYTGDFMRDAKPWWRLWLRHPLRESRWRLGLKVPMKREVPYPPVFRDWQFPELRVATSSGPGGPGVEMYLGDSTWKRVELTEEDACLMAASLLRRAGKDKLADKVLKGME